MNMSDITVDFLQKLIQNDYPDVRIRDFKCGPGTKPGDNISGEVYRISLNGTREEEEKIWQNSIICKRLAIPSKWEEFRRFFRNESAFYNKIWPALFGFQNLWKVQDLFNAVPKCYLAQDRCLMLHDLTRDGFIMVDRRQGLSLQQCYLVLKHLAHFHSLSMCMKYYDPKGFYELLNEKDGIFEVLFIKETCESNNEVLQQTTEAAMSWVAKELSGSPDREFYLDKFRWFCNEERLRNTMVETVGCRTPLSVICHGDCWTNNLMFKYMNGQVVDLRMIDFQQVRYSSLAIDLIYILYLCIERNLRIQNFDALLKFYGDEFRKRVFQMSVNDSELLNIMDKKKLDELLREDIRRCLPFGLGIALNLFPIMTMADENDNDSSEQQPGYNAEEASKASDTILPLKANKECRRKLTQLFLDLVEKGIL